jgi:uncharacterized RDD family membrane protein YckC
VTVAVRPGGFTMQCRFCLYHNPEDEERCHRCGKRLSGDITLDGISLAGANALAPRHKTSVLDTSSDDVAAAPLRRTPRVAAAVAGRQTSLFSGELSSNVIPFESIHRPAANLPANTEVLSKTEPGPRARQLTAAKQAIKKQSSSRRMNESGFSDTQGSLELEFMQPAPQTPRTLKTTVEAQIVCDAEVAAPMHRSVAAILDAAMILIACGIFLAIFQCFGGGVRVDKFDAVIFSCAIVLITMFYGMLFAIAGRETAGQRWTELRLINFDGHQPDGPSRALRFAGGWLSFCACGIGMLWSLLDEENLTWHDHMSKTFLTMREVDSSFFRERPR